MATVKISSHRRGRKNSSPFQVREYTQNRKDGKKKGRGRGYSDCQAKIAEVIKLNNPYNATVEQLRNDPKWRSYVCNCTESSHHAWITGGKDGQVTGPSTPKDFTFQAPSWNYKKNGKKHPVTIKGRVINVRGRMYNSRCGVQIFIPAHRRALHGKQIVRLVAG